MNDGPVLFYDSDCGFCNGVVQFVLRHEQEPRLRFAPVLGKTAATAGIDPALGQQTLVLLENGQVYIRSKAVWRIMHHMGGTWRKGGRLMGLIPVPLADLGYRGIARIRKHLPGATNCSLLPPELRTRFLD